MPGRELKVSIPTVAKWRKRFALFGLRGLRDHPRPGKPQTYDAVFRNRVLVLLEQPPPLGTSRWDGPAVAQKLILDNYCTHKKNDDWLAKFEGRVHFHFTPTSASWLNQIEIVFSLLQRKTLSGASFKTKDQLREAIEAFIQKHNERAKPFRWRKREVKGSQLRTAIVHLCN